jgi:hypothetical protein
MELTERTRPDWCRWQLCRAVAARLRFEPDVVMAILRNNIEVARRNGVYNYNTAEWDEILQTHTPEQICEILEAETHESQRLRSNLRGMRVLDEDQRVAIIRSSHGIQPFSEALIQPARSRDRVGALR